MTEANIHLQPRIQMLVFFAFVDLKWHCVVFIPKNYNFQMILKLFHCAASWPDVTLVACPAPSWENTPDFMGTRHSPASTFLPESNNSSQMLLLIRILLYLLTQKVFFFSYAIFAKVGSSLSANAHKPPSKIVVKLKKINKMHCCPWPERSVFIRGHYFNSSCYGDVPLRYLVRVRVFIVYNRQWM